MSGGKYINPFTDFGFKRLFGEEANKDIQNYPEALQEKIFQKLFGEAEIASLVPDELEAYDESLKVYRDMKGCIDTAHREGYDAALEELGYKTG